MVVAQAPCAVRLEMTIGRVKPVAIGTAVLNISLPSLLDLFRPVHRDYAQGVALALGMPLTESAA